ncbi:MAG: serine protease [Deltaproteobacteria bacterium]|nr:serine protease [Deltaproteobacteria bacterium]
MSRTTAVLCSTLFVGAVGAAGCGQAAGWGDEAIGTQSIPVVGGEPAQPDEYPSTVALTDTGGEPFCTGTLVGPKTVVTAGHCIDAMPPSKMRVIYGSAHPAAEPASARHPVAKAVQHPSYDPGAKADADGLAHSNDIGVVVLVNPIAGAKTTPILPPDQVDTVLYPYRDTHIVGFGIYDMPYTGGDLYKAVTPHIRHVQWEMLAGKPGKPDTCNGDSGGPAFVLRGCELWLVGVTSRAWAKSTTPCGDGGIYTIASQYLAFIEQVSGEPLPVGTGSGGGLPVGVCEDAGADVQVDVLPDVDGKCFSSASACDPITNFGCDAAKGEACTIGADGYPVCHGAPNKVGPGQMCDQSALWCVPGYYCGTSLRCEKLCCSNADCGSSGTCTHLEMVLGTLGTCPPVTPIKDASTEDGAGGSAADGGKEGGAGKGGGAGAAGQADAGVDAGAPAQPVAAADDGGCGCRAVGAPAPGWGALMIGLVGLAARRLRRSRRATSSP